MTKIYTISLLTLLCCLPLSFSQANVLVESTAADVDFNFTPFSEATSNVGSGNVDDFVLSVCSTITSAGNTFNDPAPGIWTELDNASCGDGICVHGIWVKFTDSESNEITCSWTQPQVYIGFGVFRYTGVDLDNPIIDVECDSGTGALAIAPSIVTEPGSQVVRIFTGGIIREQTSTVMTDDAQNNTTQELTGFYSAALFSNSPTIPSIVNIGFSDFSPNGGDIGVETFNIEQFFFDPFVTILEGPSWRACTIGIRMQTRNVPAVSEWGLIAMAGILGIAAFMVIRRRKAAT